MTSLFLESWITKYETLHQAIKPIQSKNHFFIKKENGEVETRFLVAPPEKKDVTVFPTQIAMLQPVSYVCEDGLKINAFCEDGKPGYEGKSPSGHIWWDICDCAECRKEETLKEDHSRRRKKIPLKKSSKKDIKQVIQDHDQNPKPPLIPHYLKVLLQIPKCQPFPTSQTHPQKPLSCYMFDHASPSYSQDFPPLQSFEHPQTSTKHIWKIKNPVGTNPDGIKRHVLSTEEALNWQAENVMAQNQAL
ncbi:hypothetical protein SO802_026717 [Lithocarpus litseifolius]|uniref:Uncharacterized protein n=1 Tax=Lithocarpus litseifolius TaxID=425828 RepID=A0AAW2C293_9ROSI